MPKKKKLSPRHPFTSSPSDDEDWEDYDGPKGEEPATGDESPSVLLTDFVINEKVRAFINDYEPCDEFDPGAERFGDAELRVYFKAYVTSMGDPLSLYIDDLKLANPPFRMVTSLATNRPAIFARRKM
jgi:hypothetical protein